MASEIGRAQTFSSDIKRVTDPRNHWMLVVEAELENSAKESNSLVGGIDILVVGIQSTTGHEESGGNMRGPSPNAKYDHVTDRV